MKKLLIIFLLLAGNTLYGQSTCTCNCLRPLFDYLILSGRLFTPESDHIILSSLMRDARYAGFDVSYVECAILYKNINNYFYATSMDASGSTYAARIGDCEVTIKSTGGSVTFANLRSDACSGNDVVTYHNNGGSSQVATLQIGSCYTCTTVASGLCYSAVTDTSVNAYTYGLAGNWRPVRNYVYYGNRTETQTSTQVNLRSGGTVDAFVPFWKVNNKKWVSQQDTTRWLWNSETTLFNQKGLELETRDPLGRYNAGLYGYQDALLIAATQNSHYREASFEGFEDYFYGVPACDEVCSTSRNLDFSGYKGWMTTTERHTGKYSLHIPADSVTSISAAVVQADTTDFGLSFNTGTNLCTGSAVVLKSVRANQHALIPIFSPIAGKKYVVSCWVKEGQQCTGERYANNRLSIVVKGGGDSSTTIATPRGAIIEGWQRYDQVVVLPAGCTMISINLQSLNHMEVYLDDLRIHPYNSNMKSFVYDAVNLRLMAELDENNYATLFEYNDEGILIRKKKETERGIKTITESRSALLKQ